MCLRMIRVLKFPRLDMQPGVRSARYAGDQRSNTDNIRLLLENLRDKDDWSARFRTVVALILEDNVHTFEGVVNGHIISDLKGEGGFGYDPVFIPEGYTQTFAEMDADQKNSISHRGRAIRSMASFLSPGR